MLARSPHPDQFLLYSDSQSELASRWVKEINSNPAGRNQAPLFFSLLQRAPHKLEALGYRCSCGSGEWWGDRGEGLFLHATHQSHKGTLSVSGERPRCSVLVDTRVWAQCIFCIAGLVQTQSLVLTTCQVLPCT